MSSPVTLPAQPFQSVLIYGMGMMGTSLALALQKTASPPRITGIVRSTDRACYLEKIGAADQIELSSSLDLGHFDLQEFDLIVLGLPLCSILEAIPQLPDFRGVITDLSSAHVAVANSFQKRPELLFVGSHPLCGSEESGPRAANADLFRDAICFVIKKEQGDSKFQESCKKVITFWRALGMHTFLVEAQEHDQALAYLSHLPHLISGQLSLWALAPSVVQKLIDQIPLPLVGGGFQDMARIAGSNPQMWADIVQNNRENLLVALESWIAGLEQLATALKQEDRSFWHRWFTLARQARNRLCRYPLDS